MKLNYKSLLLYFSLGLNLALILILLIDFFPGLFLPFFSGRFGRPKHRHFFREKVGVDKQKWRQLKPRLEKFKVKFRRSGKKIGECRRNLLATLSADTVDREIVEKNRECLQRAQRKKHKMWVEHMLELREILDSQEQERLFEFFRRHPPPGFSHKKH